MAKLFEYFNTLDSSYHSSGYISPGLRMYDAQTFTAISNHTITGVKLKLFRHSNFATYHPGIITVAIRATDVNGLPTGPDLCSGTTDGDTLTTTPGEWREIIFNSPILVISGIKYAIVIYLAPTIVSAQKVYWRLATSGINPSYYSGGAMCSSSDNGVTWSASENLDFMFEVYGPFPKVKVKSGKFLMGGYW